MKLILLILMSTTLFSTSVALGATESDRDLYVFFINSDGDYMAHICDDKKSDCAFSDLVKKDVSSLYFEKTVDFAKSCDLCDVVIVHIKPEKLMQSISNKEGIQERELTFHEQFYIYRDGTLKKKEYILRLSAWVPLVPVVSLLTLPFKTKHFKKEIKLFKKTLGNNGSLSKYRHQYAFLFSHKLSDKKTRYGSFSSSKFTKFSLNSFLDGINKLSLTINGKQRPYDALFLSQCLSTIETVHQVYQSQSAKLTFASPEIVPLAGLVGLDINSLRDHLNETNQSVKENIKDWMKNLFDSEAEENISEQIKVEYTLSLYDMVRLKNMEEDFLSAVNIVKKARKLNKKNQKQKDIASGKEKNQMFSFSNSDCQKLSEPQELLPLMQRLSQATFYLSKPGTLQTLINSSSDLPTHSGWSCL